MTVPCAPKRQRWATYGNDLGYETSTGNSGKLNAHFKSTSHAYEARRQGKYHGSLASEANNSETLPSIQVTKGPKSGRIFADSGSDCHRGDHGFEGPRQAHKQHVVVDQREPAVRWRKGTIASRINRRSLKRDGQG